LGKASAIEDVVSEDQRDRPVADKFTPNDEGFGEAIRLYLLSIGERYPEVRPVSEKILELG